MEEVLDSLNCSDRKIISIILKLYPVYYEKSVDSIEYFLNIHQTMAGCCEIEIASIFPTIPDVATKFLRINGFKAQEKRRDDDFQASGVSIADVRVHLTENVLGLKQRGKLHKK